ncbi:MAG: hypothetical protein AB7U73_11275 [Pirellulales bacterium]
MRTSLAMLFSALAAGLVGCSTCQHPYDYCGPTFSGPGGPDPCLINERAGSAFTGTMMPPPMRRDNDEFFSEPGPQQAIPPGEFETVPADGEEPSLDSSSSTGPADAVVQPVSGIAPADTPIDASPRPSATYRR